MAQTNPAILAETTAKVKGRIRPKVRQPPGSVTWIGTRQRCEQMTYWASSAVDAELWIEVLAAFGISEYTAARFRIIIEEPIEVRAVWDEVA